MKAPIQRKLHSRWAISVIIVIWAWPSAVFLPPILGQPLPIYFLLSISITLTISSLLFLLSYQYLAQANAKALGIVAFASVGIAIVGITVYLTSVQMGIFGGLGGDRGDALDVGLSRLLNGFYPYGERTSWGGQITPLPGGFILALPAYIFVHSGFASVYLVPLAVFIMWKSNKRVAAIASIALVLSPVFWADVLSSGDLVVSAFLLFAVALGTVKSANSLSSIRWLWPVALGVVAATRVTSIITIFIVAAIVWGSGKPRRAISQAVIALAVVAGLSVPFYLISPDEFSPLHTTSFARGPLGIAIAGLVILAAVWFALTSKRLQSLPDAVKLMWTLTLPTIALTTIPLILDPSISTLYLSTYAVMAVVAPVGVLGLRPHKEIPNRVSSSLP